MNINRILAKFAFFILIAVILNFLMPASWAFGIVWMVVGAIGVERLFRGIFKFQNNSDIVDYSIIIIGSGFGFITYLLAEYMGDEESEIVYEPKAKPSKDKVPS
jgi:hypothetical protein